MELIFRTADLYYGCLVVYLVGEFLSKKDQGAVLLTVVCLCIVPHRVLGWPSGLDITTQSGLVAVMANFGTAFMITNIGTLITIWKT